MSPVAQAADAFRAAHGRDPDGVWSAPGRVNLIGEHTDYNDGLVLPFALPHRVAAAAAARSDGRLAVATLGSDGVLRHAAPVPVSNLQPGTIADWSAYVAGVAWVLREQALDAGADVVLATNLPSGAGLSSSAAVECASALALLDLAGVTRTRAQVAAIAQQAENDFVGMPCGILDQTASLSCIEGHVLHLDVQSGAATQVPFVPADHDLGVLVIDTRAHHSLASSAYADRRAGCEQSAKALGVSSLRAISAAELPTALAQLPPELAPLVRHVVTENDRVQRVVDLLTGDQPSAIGPLLNASHESLRDDYQVSCLELDLAVAVARERGALGARMTGGGFGGSAIALAHPSDCDAISTAVRAAFRREGLRAPRICQAVPSAGAGRDR